VNEQTPVAVSQVPAFWHWLGAAQLTGLAPVQVPAWQVSVWVQLLPSLHEEPLVLVVNEQTPVVVLQTPGFWQAPGAAQVTAVAPVHAPAWQVSPCVQALLSLQELPSTLLPYAQTPVAELQTPAVWHVPGAAQVTGLAPVQVPAWQVSVCVQASPSLHEAPLALLV
jgi:hypothetical protein